MYKWTRLAYIFFVDVINKKGVLNYWWNSTLAQLRANVDIASEINCFVTAHAHDVFVEIEPSPATSSPLQTHKQRHHAKSKAFKEKLKQLTPEEIIQDVITKRCLITAEQKRRGVANLKRQRKSNDRKVEHYAGLPRRKRLLPKKKSVHAVKNKKNKVILRLKSYNMSV